jgi:ribosome maturation factor RimP
MRKWQAFVSVVLVISLYHVTVIQSLEAASTDVASISGQVAEYGVGAKLNLKLAGGKKLVGSVESIDEHGFRISKPNRPTTYVRYDEVAQVRFAERAYHARQAADPLEARRLVLSLGAGRHVVVKFSGRELHGHIQTIDADTFTLLPDHQTTSVQIAYRDVAYLEKNLSFGATIVLVVLIVAVVAVISVAATR